MRHRSLDELPDVLTIHEAADFMRVSAGVVYEMARRYRATNGREGLPVFMAGERMMRVSKLELAKLRRREARWRRPNPAERHCTHARRRAHRGCGGPSVRSPWAVLECVAEHAHDDRGRTVSCRSVRDLADRSPVSPRTPSPGRCVGSPTRASSPTKPAASPSGRFGAGHYVLTLPPSVFVDAVVRNRRSLARPLSPERRVRPAGRRAARAARRRSRAGRSVAPSRVRPDLPISGSRICTMVPAARRATPEAPPC